MMNAPALSLRHLKRVSSMLPVLLIAAGCANPQACPGNWKQAGYNDAMAGRGALAIRRYAKVCTGRTPDQAQWQAGYNEGIARYCTERHANWLGRVRGDFAAASCPASDRKRLADAHHRGTMYREMQEDLRDSGFGILLPRF